MTRMTTDEKVARARALSAAQTPEECSAIREGTLETFLTSVVQGTDHATETLEAATWGTWANGYGVWHVRVGRTCVAPLLAARKALRDELTARDSNVDRDVWLHCVEVAEASNADTVVYRERLPEDDSQAPVTPVLQISEGTWADIVAASREQVPVTLSDADALARIASDRPCLDADTTDAELVEWVRAVILPTLESKGLL